MAIFWPNSETISEYNANIGESTFSCSSCAECILARIVSGGINSPPYTAYLRIIEHTCTSADYDITVTYDAFTIVGNRFIIQCNDVDVYNTGCVTGSGGATVTIPAGTSKILIQVDGSCSGGTDDLWNLTISCA